MYEYGLNKGEINISNKFQYKNILKKAIYGDEIAIQQLIIRFIPKAKYIYSYLQDVLPNDVEENDIIQFMAESIVSSLAEYRARKINTLFIQHVMNIFVSKINNIYTKDITDNGDNIICGTYIKKLESVKQRFICINDILQEYKLCNNYKYEIMNTLFIQDIISIIYRKINTLKPKHKFVIVQYFLKEKTLQEIGEILGCSRENVRQHIINAIQILRFRLQNLKSEINNY